MIDNYNSIVSLTCAMQLFTVVVKLNDSNKVTMLEN